MLLNEFTVLARVMDGPRAASGRASAKSCAKDAREATLVAGKH